MSLVPYTSSPGPGLLSVFSGRSLTPSGGTQSLSQGIAKHLLNKAADHLIENGPAYLKQAGNEIIRRTGEYSRTSRESSLPDSYFKGPVTHPLRQLDHLLAAPSVYSRVNTSRPTFFSPSTMPPKRRGKQARTRRGKPRRGVNMRPGYNPSLSFEEVPASTDAVMRNSTAIHDIKPIKHNIFGYPGVRIVGSQPFSTAVITNTTNECLTTDTLATVTSGNYVPINPDILNGPVAGQAQFYEHFCFRELVFEYITVISSGATGSYCRIHYRS